MSSWSSSRGQMLSLGRFAVGSPPSGLCLCLRAPCFCSSLSLALASHTYDLSSGILLCTMTPFDDFYPHRMFTHFRLDLFDFFFLPRLRRMGLGLGLKRSTEGRSTAGPRPLDTWLETTALGGGATRLLSGRAQSGSGREALSSELFGGDAFSPRPATLPHLLFCPLSHCPFSLTLSPPPHAPFSVQPTFTFGRRLSGCPLIANRNNRSPPFPLS